jgi:hypothetical protein
MTIIHKGSVFDGVLITAIVVVSSISHAFAGEGTPKQEDTVTIAARVSKTVYGPNEPVPIVVGISNHGMTPVYSVQKESDFLRTQCYVRDVNGREVPLPRDLRLPRPPPPPPTYYMERDGKTKGVQPVYEIRGHGVMVALKEDVLRIYHGHLPDGTYSLDLGEIEIIHDVNDLIVREGVGPRLWVDLNSAKSRVIHKLGTVKVEIRSKPGEQSVAEKAAVEPSHPTGPLQPMAQATTRGWLWFLGGAAIGVVGLWLGLSLKKNSRLNR